MLTDGVDVVAVGRLETRPSAGRDRKRHVGR